MRFVKKANAAESEAARDEAVQEAAKALDAVRVLSKRIDDMFAERLDDISRLRDRTRAQAEEAITAAQAALASTVSALTSRRS